MIPACMAVVLWCFLDKKHVTRSSWAVVGVATSLEDGIQSLSSCPLVATKINQMVEHELAS